MLFAEKFFELFAHLLQTQLQYIVQIQQIGESQVITPVSHSATNVQVYNTQAVTITNVLTTIFAA
jgi:hypothetical protein